MKLAAFVVAALVSLPQLAGAQDACVVHGRILGYEEDTTLVPYKTTFNGLYDRARSFDEKPPFDLPKRYKEGKAKLDLDTPLDFVYTADTIGGNSGTRGR